MTPEPESPEEVQRAAYRVACTDDGRVLLRHLVAKYGYETRTTLVAGDPHVSAFHEGGRVVILDIQRLIRLGSMPQDTRPTETER